MRNGHGFILIYSIVQTATLQCLTPIKERLCKVKDMQRVPIVLVGNKCDLKNRREISTEDGEALAASFDAAFFESSAKEKINVEEVFHEIVRQVNAIEKPKKKASRGCMLL